MLRKCPSEITTAAAGLIDPPLCHSLGFRKVASGWLNYDGVPEELLEFHRGFTRELRSKHIPVFASRFEVQYYASAVVYQHFNGDMYEWEYRFLGALGLDVVRKLGLAVEWYPLDPSRWFYSQFPP